MLKKWQQKHTRFQKASRKGIADAKTSPDNLCDQSSGTGLTEMDAPLVVKNVG